MGHYFLFYSTINREVVGGIESGENDFNLTFLFFHYVVLSDPVKRREYDKKGMQYVYDYNLIVRIFSSSSSIILLMSYAFCSSASTMVVF